MKHLILISALLLIASPASAAKKANIKEYVASGGMCNQLPSLAQCAACARMKGYSPSEYMSRACRGKR